MQTKIRPWFIFFILLGYLWFLAITSYTMIYARKLEDRIKQLELQNKYCGVSSCTEGVERSPDGTLKFYFKMKDQ